jgi:diguanylate cyclase (GGDEF)-like protein
MNNPVEGRQKCRKEDPIRSEGEASSDRTAGNLLLHLATNQKSNCAVQFQAVIETLSLEIKRSVRTRQSFAVLLFGLNGLAQINERYGIETGSRAIFRLARVFEHFCRSIDTAVQYRDEEFVIVLPETAFEGADQVALRIREGLANDREEPLISASVGIAIYPDDGRFLPELLQSADQAFIKMSHQKCSPDSSSHGTGLMFRHRSAFV